MSLPCARRQSGRLRETERLDLKRELPGGDRGSEAIAVDLASLALTGGTVLVAASPRDRPSH